MKKGIEVTRIDHSNCFFLCSHSFIYQITSDLQSSLSCSLTVTCLKHVQFSVFYSKLHVLHVSVVIFKCSANLFKLSECFWEFLLHLSDRHRCTNAGNNVFTLCILKEFSHQFLLSCSRVTSKCNTCTTVITHVTKCHRLYVYSSSPRIRDVVVTTVYIGTRVVPRTEYGFDSTHQLLFWIIWEIFTNLSFVFSLELCSQLFQVVCSKLNILLNTTVSFHFVDELFEVFLSYFHNYVRIHLDETTVAVPCPAGISGFLCDYIYYCLI